MKKVDREMGWKWIKGEKIGSRERFQSQETIQATTDTVAATDLAS